MPLSNKERQRKFRKKRKEQFSEIVDLTKAVAVTIEELRRAIEQPSSGSYRKILRRMKNGT